MTLDEAIKHAEKVMIENLDKTKGRNASDPIAINCFECAEEHRQLAEWLKELKQKRQAIEDIKAEIQGNMESIIGKYDSSIPKAEMPSYKLERNSARRECIDIIDKHVSPTGAESEG